MNSIIIDPPIKSQTEIHGEANKKQEFKFLGTIQLKPGLKLWSLNIKTVELKQVEVNKNKDIKYEVKNGKLSETKKNDHALYNPDCIYFQALNQANAERKAAKIITKALDSK